MIKPNTGSRSYQMHLIRLELLRIGLSKKQNKINNVSPFIHSWRTWNKYKSIWNSVLDFGKLNKMEKITFDIAIDYLKEIKNRGYSKRQIQTVVSALRKLENGWNRVVKKNFKDDTRVKLNLANLDIKKLTADMKHPKVNRAFNKPWKVIENLRLEIHKITARLLLEGGLRIREANHIKIDQLEKEPCIKVKGKGGLKRTIWVSDYTYSFIKASVLVDGEFYFNQTNFRRDLEQAIERSGENGSPHSFRYNFAQRLYYHVLPKLGYRRKQCLQIVSERLGHHRPDITNKYLAR